MQNQVQYYILKETTPPDGYRPLPTDLVLEFHPANALLTVVNRWTTGSYANFISTVTGNADITYGAFHPDSGEIRPSQETVQKSAQRDGLTVAVPMMLVENKWKALYGSNDEGFYAVTPADREVVAWRKAALTAILYQCSNTAKNTPHWYLQWDEDMQRLTGELSDLPGRAQQYQLINAENPDMKMVYAIIDPAVFEELLGQSGLSKDEQYAALGAYVKSKTDAGRQSGGCRRTGRGGNLPCTGGQRPGNQLFKCGSICPELPLPHCDSQ